MNCHASYHSDHCCCGSPYGTQFWSKKKKLEVLEHYLECLDEKKKDIQDAINELKEKE